jgi:DNA-binding NtrC family response regulator
MFFSKTCDNIQPMSYVVLHRPPSPKGAFRERLLLIGGFQPEFYEALKKTDLFVEEVLDGAEALACAAQREYGVVVCSLRMAGAWGLDVLDAILKADPSTPVIMSTAEQSPQVVVEAMRRGAFDYVIEPYVDLPGILRVIDRAVARRLALRDGKRLRDMLAGKEVRFFEDLVGNSTPLRELCEQVRQVAPTLSPVLIEGPSGSGKELIARAIHGAGARRGQAFISVNCGAIPENLLESELFGHEKGAFTGADSTRVGLFEEAHGGTLFLDEIGLMSPPCQGKLLRVLEGGVIRRVGASREFQVDVRVVAATNEPLHELAAQKRFREDLFYRLNVVALRVPSLAERREDVPLLSYHLAERFSKAAKKPFEAFSPKALAALSAYQFPGNVRELRNIVERAVVFSRGPVIGLQDLPEQIRRLAELPESAVASEAATAARDAHVLNASAHDMGLDERLRRIELELIKDALRRAKGNHSQAAKLLQIKRTTLLQKLARLGLAKDRSRPKIRGVAKRRKLKPARP